MMALFYHLLLLIIVLHFKTKKASPVERGDVILDNQPFRWGVATAAYQIEGAVKADGRGPSIWDTFSALPGKISHGDQGTVADDSYFKYSEDIRLIRDMGLNSYRFSISWSRILPDGSKGSINFAAINHYNKLIDELIDANIEPFVTLYHWDLPQALEDRYEGWLSTEIERDFRDYADVCFANFGDRVKKWITLNEPWTYSLMGYVAGIFAPGRCSDRTKCARGNSSTEGYIVAHNSLNAHAAAVELYRTRYQQRQGGQIGIVLNHDWAEPLTASKSDQAAATRRNEFAIAWFADPLVFGHYPQSMTSLVGDRLPQFTPAQRKRLTGSFDFLGINHYSTKYYTAAKEDKVGGVGGGAGSNGWGDDQMTVETKYSQYGLLIGPQAASSWLNVVPWGFYKMLKWNNQRYTVDGNKPVIYVTENGCDVPNESSMPMAQALHDSFRIDYYRQYLASLDRAIKEGVDVRGYFAWSLLDNFEWADGYDYRFGLHYVDYNDSSRRRYPKDSAKFFAQYAARTKYGWRQEVGSSGATQSWL